MHPRTLAKCTYRISTESVDKRDDENRQGRSHVSSDYTPRIWFSAIRITPGDGKPLSVLVKGYVARFEVRFRGAKRHDGDT